MNQREPQEDATIRRILQSVLCLSLTPLLVAQQTCQADRTASGVTATETLFAYRTSMLPDESVNRADSSASLGGLSIVPFKVPVEVAPVDPAAWANATLGSTLTLRVLHDVIVEHHHSNYADAYAGTLIEAKVIRIRKGQLRTRHGRMEPRVKEVLVESI